MVRPRLWVSFRSRHARPRPAVPALALLAALICVPASTVAQQELALGRSLDLAERGIKLRYATSWTHARSMYANATELRFAPEGEGTRAPFAAKILLTTETRLDHADAVERLKQIAQEYPAPATFLVVGGWPAVQRSVRVLKQERGEDGSDPNGPPMVIRVTTAIAAGSTLVRVEGVLPDGAPADVLEQVFATGRGLVFQAKADPKLSQAEVERLRSTSPARSAIAASDTLVASSTSDVVQKAVAEDASTLDGDPNAAGFTPQRLQGGSEIEMVSSNNGLTIVVASQDLFRTSNDGGFTFPFSGSMPFANSGDPSLAIGRSGTVYWAGIRNTTNCGSFGCATGIAVSTDQGQTFSLRSNAVLCPNSGAARCFPDQEHIAADRVNAGGGGDQVYSTWRNFDATDQDPALVCSQDSGTNWTAPITVGPGFVPRINVGQDGFVYVIYRQGGNIMLHKYSSCANSLTPQVGFPRVVTAVNDVTCPVPGLDRCNDGNILSSHMVAVDDTNANHIFVTYADNNAAGNERIIVRDSIDGGVNWPATAARTARVNALVTARRFMPWICTTNGRAYVSWYDRRFATTTNDQTDFFASGARLNASGDLVALPEVQITNTSDPQCASGWPCNTRSPGDSDACTIQPQLAGVCCAAGPNCPGSQQRCDFSVGGCPGGETCTTGGGCPKYGDYNGNACAAGRFYVGWASATPPSGIPTPPGGIQTYFASVLNRLPVANAGSDQTLECTGNNRATALLDASGSTDPDGFADIQSFAWSEGPTPLGSGQTLPVPFSLGPAHTVTLTVLDRARDSSTDTVSIRVQDTTRPNLVGVPGDTTVECNAVPPAAAVTVADTCDPSPSLSFNEVSTQTSNGTCSDQNYTITRTWTARDATGNERVAVQVVTVQDTTKPTLIGVPADTTVECDAVPPAAVVTAIDNCDTTPTLVFNEVSTQTNNGTCSDFNYTITRTWTASDNCGNTRAEVQVITVQDTTPPVVTLLQPNVDNVGLPSVQIPITVRFTAVDNCSTTTRDVLKLSWRDAPPGAGCTLLDGNVFGDRDGMLSDEFVQVNKYQLCQAMARCGLLNLSFPTIVVESTDPCGNTGSDRHIIRLRLLKTEVCGL